MCGLSMCWRFIKGLVPLLAVLVVICTASAAQAEPTHGGTIKVITQNDLKVLDPLWTTAYISRNHGYMIYDVLFALDDHLTVQPQMIDTWEVSPDRLCDTFTLRDGLRWHDGPPVTSNPVNHAMALVTKQLLTKIGG